MRLFKTLIVIMIILSLVNPTEYKVKAAEITNNAEYEYYDMTINGASIKTTASVTDRSDSFITKSASSLIFKTLFGASANVIKNVSKMIDKSSSATFKQKNNSLVLMPKSMAVEKIDSANVKNAEDFKKLSNYYESWLNSFFYSWEVAGSKYTLFKSSEGLSDTMYGVLVEVTIYDNEAYLKASMVRLDKRTDLSSLVKLTNAKYDKKNKSVQVTVQSKTSDYSVRLIYNGVTYYSFRDNSDVEAISHAVMGKNNKTISSVLVDKLMGSGKSGTMKVQVIDINTGAVIDVNGVIDINLDKKRVKTYK